MDILEKPSDRLHLHPILVKLTPFKKGPHKTTKAEAEVLHLQASLKSLPSHDIRPSQPPRQPRLPVSVWHRPTHRL